MRFEVETEVIWKFWREPPAYCNRFLIKIEGLYSKQVVPESEEVDVADWVGFEEVGDGGPVVVGLDVEDDVVVRRQMLGAVLVRTRWLVNAENNNRKNVSVEWNKNIFNV